MKHSNRSIVSFLVLILGVVIISACSATSEPQTPLNTTLTEEQFINEKISYYTHETFRFVENLSITETNDQYKITVALIPEVGSFPVKEAIYRQLAEYAYDINRFFPEIVGFDFTVLWDDFSKQEAIHAVIDEVGVTNLVTNYSNIGIDHNGNFDTSYKTIFTEISESDIAKKWREQVTSEDF